MYIGAKSDNSNNNHFNSIVLSGEMIRPAMLPKVKYCILLLLFVTLLCEYILRTIEVNLLTENIFVKGLVLALPYFRKQHLYRLWLFWYC